MNSRVVRRLIGFVLLLLIVASILTSYRGDDAWRWLVANERRLRHMLTEQRPLAGFFGGLAVFTALSLVPGLVGKSLAVGWLFGFWRSLAIVNISLTIAAMIEFGLTRFLLHDRIQSRFGLYLTRINRALELNGAFYLFSMRVAHVPYTATNYVMGATPMRPLPFWWATQLGLLPGNILFCYAGSQLPTLEEITTGGLTHLVSWQLWLAFILLAVFPWIGKILVERWQKRLTQPDALP
jgi:uncharacterized membrane protein YdjX (TVP38/TMEM64 family)